MGTVAVTMKAPFDDMTKEELLHWQRDEKKSYRGGMRTTVVVSKGKRNPLACPVPMPEGNPAELALLSCGRYTPNWNRGVKVLADFLNEHILEEDTNNFI